MTKEALRLALEALEMFCEHGAILRPIETRDAIKEALANEALEKMAENARELGLDYEPAQEPCGGCKGSGWVPRDPDIGTDQECFVCGGSGAYPKEPEQEPVGEIVDAIEGAFKCSFTKMLPVGTKLYTTPPQRTWVGLTDKEIDELWMSHHDDFGNALSAIDYERAIEAKLKERNG